MKIAETKRIRIDPDKALLIRCLELDGTSYPGLVEHEGDIWVSYGVGDASEAYLSRIKI